MSILSGIDIHPVLIQRINKTVECPIKEQNSFVLYLPTVNLRCKHNPAFAFACHLANQHCVPVVILAIVLDDAHLPNAHSFEERRAIVSTARRLAFVLEALQQATQDWQRHGAGVAIRLHGPACRTPHHLTLVRHSVAIVVDEPFVNPYLSLVLSVERAARKCEVPVCRVDGSTTVAPISMLQKKVDESGNITYSGVPNKAWIWEKKTNDKRRDQVIGVVQHGYFDAPALAMRLPTNFFTDIGIASALNLPAEWMNPETPSPGKRPWTVEQLSAISDLKSWVLHWPGVDTSVRPCSQTHGSASSGEQRWTRFRQGHLSNYAKLRNNITKPHAVSRMSCYLNYGCVSIFQIVFDLWQSHTSGTSKFAEEIIKWREIGYAHSFASPEYYNQSTSVPQWARLYLSQCHDANSNHIGSTSVSHTLEQLESCSTKDDTWNAMQNYLESTGELHNNARMTWGKTIVHWQKHGYPVDELLHQLVYLNDRYALDGLSPPSYAGLLWCLGWGDNPSKSLSQKTASRYRHGPSSFVEAKRALLSQDVVSRSIVTMLDHQPAAKKQRTEKLTGNSHEKKAGILSYFQVESEIKTIG